MCRVFSGQAACFLHSAQRLFIAWLTFLRDDADLARLRPSRLPDKVNGLFPFPRNAAMALSRRSRWAISSVMIEALFKMVSPFENYFTGIGYR